MKNLWNAEEAAKIGQDALQMRVYTSRLLGKESALVLHGGGNTSVKSTVTNLFGETEEVLFVKGSGWDLATIEAAGFAPVKQETLLKMAKLESLTDSQMVTSQRAAMLDSYAPNPSVEAILHAIIPFKFVDHTHADAVVAVTNTPHGEDHIRKIYGNRVLIVPYVMPGFVLARKIYEMTRNLDWSQLDGIILMNHGVFTFNDDAKASYDMMIQLVSEAESYLEKKGASLIEHLQLIGMIRLYFKDHESFEKIHEHLKRLEKAKTMTGSATQILNDCLQNFGEISQNKDRFAKEQLTLLMPAAPEKPVSPEKDPPKE
ncbi:MAG: class II aldolase/adducin family protein [SAR324 cluster bacterium]|nr:class II aldolase/adducin family protein [SAR324 cluster bacterium]